MKTNVHVALFMWLEIADYHYLEGRLLFQHRLVNGACEQLWISVEQMMKILLLQKEASDIISTVTELDEICDALNKKGKKYGHNADDLIEKLKRGYSSLDMSKHRPTIKKLEEVYFGRYLRLQSMSISNSLIHEVDELYFVLRDNIEPQISTTLIDEIDVRRQQGWPHPIPAFAVAYDNNKAFRTRLRDDYEISGPDHKKYLIKDGKPYLI